MAILTPLLVKLQIHAMASPNGRRDSRSSFSARMIVPGSTFTFLNAARQLSKLAAFDVLVLEGGSAQIIQTLDGWSNHLCGRGLHMPAVGGSNCRRTLARRLRSVGKVWRFRS